MEQNQYVGKVMEYEVNSGEKRVATVEKVEFHQELGKELFVGKSPNGHTVKLTKDEIDRFI